MASPAILRIGADSSGLTAGLATAGGKLRSWGKKVSGELRGVFRGAFSGLMDIGGMGGVAGLAFAAKNVFDFEKRLVRLKIASRSTAADMNTMRAAIQRAAMTRGVDASELLGGLETYVALTGNVNAARDSLDTFAMVAGATGAASNDIATTAAALSQNFKVLPQDMERAFSVMITQGKEGAVEFKDVAALIQGLTPAFANFGTTGVEGVAKLNASLQVARQGFGTATEAATGLEAVMTALTDTQTVKKLAKAGVKVFDVDPKTGKRHLRDFMTTVQAAYKAANGDALKIADWFGRKEAVKTVTKFGQAGMGEYQNLVDKGLESKEAMKDSALWAGSFAGKLQSAKSRLDTMFSEALVKHIDTFVKLFEKLVTAISYVVEHPGAMAALWAGMKLGGMGGGGGVVGAALGGGGGIGAALGGGGGAAAVGGASAMGTAMNVGRGALVGYAVATTLADDQGDFAQGLITATGALAGMPGTLGMIGKAGLLAETALLGIAKWQGHKIAEAEKAEQASPYGAYGKDRAEGLIGTVQQGNEIDKRMGSWSTAGTRLEPVGGPLDQKKRENARWLIKKAVALGAATDEGAGVMTFNKAKLQATLGADESLTEQDRERILSATAQAFASRGDRELRRMTGGGGAEEEPKGPGIGERVVGGIKGAAELGWARLMAGPIAQPALARIMPNEYTPAVSAPKYDKEGHRIDAPDTGSTGWRMMPAAGASQAIKLTITGSDELTSAIAKSMSKDPEQRRK